MKDQRYGCHDDGYYYPIVPVMSPPREQKGFVFVDKSLNPAIPGVTVAAASLSVLDIVSVRAGGRRGSGRRSAVVLEYCADTDCLILAQIHKQTDMATSLNNTGPVVFR